MFDHKGVRFILLDPATGTLTAIRPGTVTVTVASGPQTKSATVTIA